MFKIALQGIKGQKSLSLLMVAVLILSFLFLTLTSTITSSVEYTQRQEREQLYGKHQMLYCGSLDAVQDFQKVFPDSPASVTVGTTESGQIVGTISDAYQQVANLTISEGRLPQKENEILLVGKDWGYTVGQEIPLVYTYDCVSSAEQENTDKLEEYLLRALDENREEYLQKIAPMWNQYIRSSSARKDKPAEMCRPLDELTKEQQTIAFLTFSGQLPEFKTQGETAYKSEYEQNDGMDIEYKYAISKITLLGDGFGDAKGEEITSTGSPYSVNIGTTYTVCGIAEEYAYIWNVGDLPMPQAFVQDGQLQRVLHAQEKACARYPEIRLHSNSATMLFYDEQGDMERTTSAVTDAYNGQHNAAYQLTGLSHEGSGVKAYLTGTDSHTGERKTYNVHGSDQKGYIKIGNRRQYFLFSDLTDRTFRIDGLNPIPTEPVALKDLYQTGSGPLRVNLLAYPPAGDSAEVMQLALSGILIGMSACASFQLYLQAIRKRRQKIDTLIAIGATDGQIVVLLLIEVSVFLLTAAILGCLFGIGIGMLLVPNVLHAQLHLDIHSLVTGTLCNAVAILVGAMLPAVQILKPHKGKARTGIRYVSAGRLQRTRTTEKTGYSRIWMRHCVSNPKQTAVRSVVVALMAAIVLLPLFLCHTAYRNYYAKVVNQNRPGYELRLPYAAPRRYQKEIINSIDFPYQSVKVYTTGENVLLHCSDERMNRSPVLQALRQDSNSGMLFDKLPGEETGMFVRIVAADWDSELVQGVLHNSGTSVSEEEFQSGDACIVMMPRYRSEHGLPVVKQVNRAVLEKMSDDCKSGALLHMSYQPQYAGVYAQDDAIAVGEQLQISGWTQEISGEKRMEPILHTAQCRVAGVVSQLDSAIWPFSEQVGYITILSGPGLLSSVYPSSYVRQTAEQAKYFWATSELFYPDCYGKTYLQIYEPENLKNVGEYERDVMEFAEQYGMRVTKYLPENQKMLSAAQRSGAMYLMMGANILLITAILLANLLRAELEHDRKRLGILQAMGMTDGQFLAGQCTQMLIMGVASLAVFHLLLFAGICMGFAVTSDGMGTVLCNLKLMLQFYPWKWHVGLSAIYLVLLQFLQLQAAIPMRKKAPSDFLK